MPRQAAKSQVHVLDNEKKMLQQSLQTLELDFDMQRAEIKQLVSVNRRSNPV
jgi:hypothetical protein